MKRRIANKVLGTALVCLLMASTLGTLPSTVNATRLGADYRPPTPTLASPAGQGKIAFHRSVDGSYEIAVINPDGSGLASLSQQASGPAWSPDGTKIAFVSQRDGNDEIYVMNADGTGVTRITDSPEWEMDPAWSPDSTKIAFARVPPLWQQPADVWIMNVYGSGQVQLTDHPDEDRMPSWSPDGTKIAFVSYRGGYQDIWVMNADGSEMTNLINDSDWDFGDDEPAWSSDGSKIAFAADREKRGGRDIYIMDPDGSNIVRLTTPIGQNHSPSWSPDGTKIAFASNRDGNYEIYIMNADGTSETRVTTDPVNESGPSWGIAADMGVIEEEPDIRTPIGSTDFGNVTLGSSLDKTTTIYNDGSVILTINSITRTSGSSDFTYVSPSTPFNVGAGGSQTITIRFAPSSEGAKSAIFDINSNDPDEANVTFNVSGTGITEKEPPTAYIDSILPNPASQAKDTISFTGHGTDVDGSIVAYNWRSSLDGPLNTSSSFSKPALELSIGTHTIYFKVQDNDGLWSPEVTQDLAILSQQCVVTIVSGPEANPAIVDSSGSTLLSVSATDSSGHSISYSWTATGGSFDNANLQNPIWYAPRNTTTSMVYYTLSVTARCGQGKMTSGNVEIGVRPEKVAPTVSTFDASNIDSTSTTLNGYLDSTGGLECLVWFEYGKTTSYGTSTTQVSKSSTGSFSVDVAGLNSGTTYYFRACASNSKGISYGAEVTFTTKEIQVRIDSHSADPRDVKVGEDSTLAFSFTNIGNAAWTFYAAVSLRKPNGAEVHLPLKPVTLNPSMSGSASWTYTITGEGDWDVVFGLWKEREQVNSLGHTGWLDGYVVGTLTPPKLFITSPLDINPPFAVYGVGERITAQFAITNSGMAPIVLSVLTVGGRGPYGEVVDFNWQENITLSPGDSHNYVGDLILPDKPGAYHFFCTYQTADGNWNPSVDLGPELTDDDRVEDINVVETVVRSVREYTFEAVNISFSGAKKWGGIVGEILTQEKLKLDPKNPKSSLLKDAIVLAHRMETSLRPPRDLIRETELTGVANWWATAWGKVMGLWMGVPGVKEALMQYGFDLVEILYLRDVAFVVMRESPIGHLTIQRAYGKEGMIANYHSPSGGFFVTLPPAPESYSITYKEYPDISAKIESPVGLRVYDSQGRVTGLVEAEIREEIPTSVYSEDDEKVTILLSDSSYRYEVLGTDTGTYGLTITSVEEEITTFTATNIPTSPNAIHHYTIDWGALSEGEEGVTMKIDTDGDGTFEDIKYLGQEGTGFSWVWVALAGLSGLVGVLVGAFMVRRRMSRKQVA